MVEHSIANLHLRVRAIGDAARGATAAQHARRLATAVFERAGDLLETRRPGRVIRVRRLPVRWSVDEAWLFDEKDWDALVWRLAEELADALEGQCEGAGGNDTGGDVRVFDDEAGWLAAAVVAAAGGDAADAWVHSPWGSAGQILQFLSDPVRRGLAAEVWSRLREQDAGPVAEFELRSKLADSLALAADISGPGAALKSSAGAFPATTSPVTISSPTTFPAKGSPPNAANTTFPPSQRGAGDFTSAAAASDGLIELQLPDASTSPTSESVGPAQPVTGQSAVAPAEPRADPAAPPRRDGSADPRGLPSDERWAVRTRYGGLFYLLSVALDLGMGELLWKACLDERQFLSAAAAALLGPDGAGDGAPELFGGVAPPAALPPVSAAQQREVSVALLASLAGAVPRRGLAALPHVSLTFAGRGADRLLVAVPEGAALAIFAAPAAAPVQAADALDAFLATWPRSAPAVSAPPGLRALDPLARLRPSPRGETTAAFLPGTSPDLPSPPAAALLSQLCGCLAYLFSARVAGEVTHASSFVEEFLAVPGEVAVSADSYIVRIAMDRIDPRVRRAGLDRDPGWVPWLEKSVRLVFD